MSSKLNCLNKHPCTRLMIPSMTQKLQEENVSQKVEDVYRQRLKSPEASSVATSDDASTLWFIDVEDLLKASNIQFRHRGDKLTPLVKVVTLRKKVFLESSDKAVLIQTCQTLNEWKTQFNEEPVDFQIKFNQEKRCYSMLVNHLFSEKIASVIQRKRDQLNCFGAALASVGLLSSFSHVHMEEMRFYLENSFRKLSKEELPRPGDVGIIGHKEEGFYHAFIYINDQILFNKPDVFDVQPWKLDSFYDLADAYMFDGTENIKMSFFRLKEDQKSFLFLSEETPLAQSEERRLFDFHSVSLDRAIQSLYPLDSTSDTHSSKFMNVLEHVYLILKDVEEDKLRDPRFVKALMLRFRSVLHDHQQISDVAKLFIQTKMPVQNPLSKKEINRVKEDLGLLEAIFSKSWALYEKACQKFELRFHIAQESFFEKEERASQGRILFE